MGRVLAQLPEFSNGNMRAMKRAMLDGVNLHRAQAKRLGVSDKGIMEAVQVAQLFCTYTKIADTLQLEPAFPHVT